MNGLCWQVSIESRTAELKLPCYHSKDGDDFASEGLGERYNSSVGYVRCIEMRSMWRCQHVIASAKYWSNR